MEATVNHRSHITSKLVLAGLLLAALMVGCGPTQQDGLFEKADLVFDVGEGDYRNCQTGEVLLQSPPPGHALTRVGLRWHDDGTQLDFLLEFGGVEEYPARTFTWIGFIDSTRDFFPSNDGSDHAHNRQHFGAQLQYGEKTWLHNHFWLVSSDGEWLKGAPGIIQYGDELEIRGNQIRLTIPSTFFKVSGPTDTRLGNYSWHVSTGAEDDRTHSDCVSAGLGNPWPVDLEALERRTAD
jgi:hypothetical protein